MTKKPKRDVLLSKIEAEVLDILGKQSLTETQRLKAIEVGVKVLMIRHKIGDAERAEGAFFAK